MGGGGADLGLGVAIWGCGGTSLGGMAGGNDCAIAGVLAGDGSGVPPTKIE